jgi:hypothetical protein
MRGFGGLQAFYYLQILLTGDNETGRNPARFHTREPLLQMPRFFIELQSELRFLPNFELEFTCKFHTL